MATRISTAEEQLCIEVLESKLTDLTNHVQLQKEIASSEFQELHNMLSAREHSLLQLDYVVTEATREISEKRQHLHALYTARESGQRDTPSDLKVLLEISLNELKEKIGEELSREVDVWFKKEELGECVNNVCTVVILKERPFQSEDYGLKLSPIWSRESTHNNTPMQIAIDDTTHNIFVTDIFDPILVFDKEGNYLYDIPISLGSVGIALTSDAIYASSQNCLLKIEKSSNKCLVTIHMQHRIWGIDVGNDKNIYGCQYSNNSIAVYDENLTFQKQIKLKSSHIDADTQTNTIKLYDRNMYVMFGLVHDFHLQIFSLKGELIKCLLSRSEIQMSRFFSIDRLGNIVVSDYIGNEIKIFSKFGKLLHTISNNMLPEDKKLHRPSGVAIDRQNRIIVAQKSKECYLLAF